MNHLYSYMGIQPLLWLISLHRVSLQSTYHCPRRLNDVEPISQVARFTIRVVRLRTSGKTPQCWCWISILPTKVTLKWLVDGLEHMFPHIGEENPNWLWYFLEGMKPQPPKQMAFASRGCRGADEIWRRQEAQGVARIPGWAMNRIARLIGYPIPYAPCMEYLPTFGSFIGSMLVNIPYMEHLGMVIQHSSRKWP